MGGLTNLLQDQGIPAPLSIIVAVVVVGVIWWLLINKGKW